MPDLTTSLMAGGPAALLLLVGAVPRGLADRHSAAMVTLVARLATLALAAAAGCAGMVTAFGPVDVVFWKAPGLVQVNLGTFVDSLTATMLLLVSFISLVVARFAARALLDEPRQGRFFAALALTMGAIMTLIVSRNLLMFTAAWMLTSLGLHRLLEHYPERPWAIWAARKKFLVSRIGDMFLLAALGLTIWRFGSADYAVVFAEADAIRQSGDGGIVVAAIGILLVLGAMTKSAQFPFHSWLPDTMEAPTPVSAFMHAGIINAGGFLVIRLSPLVALSHAALDLLALVGAVTALFGGIVMLTQTSIKRSLAFSTIAQMGFMMLQCGLGAFAAALLHIVAHSLYKAHAFLSCGSVVEQAVRTRVDKPAAPGVRASLLALPLVIVAAVAAVIVGRGLTGQAATATSGGLVLHAVMAVALATLLWQSMLAGSWRLAGMGLAMACGVSILSAVAVEAATRLLAGASVARSIDPPSLLDTIVAMVVVVGFLGVFALQAAATLLGRHPLVRGLYVHAANGFYCDIPARILTARVWGLSTPVP